MELEHIACDLCGSDQYRVRYAKPDIWLKGSPYRFPVVACTNCRLVFVNPRPTARSMADFYPSGYHADRNTAEHLRRYAVQRSMLPALDGLSVLDVGCARGDFLTYLLDSHGDFNAYGTDAFSNGVDDPRISFTGGAFQDAGYATGQFDLVMAWAVFEHLHQPMAYFREASRVLKPGGMLTILVTNAESAYGRIAQAEDVPRHTYHYSRDTLDRYGSASGLLLRSVDFRDDIFDGRGIGSFGMLFGKAVGFTWERYMLGLNPLQAFAMRCGRFIDRIVFASHWEARLRRSGIMVATYAKP